jgi:hypothetical protein
MWPLVRMARRDRRLKCDRGPIESHSHSRLLSDMAEWLGGLSVTDLIRRSGRYRSYLRAAQAYMLISMPTCTSTTFGVF